MAEVCIRFILLGDPLTKNRLRKPDINNSTQTTDISHDVTDVTIILATARLQATRVQQHVIDVEEN